MAKQEAKGKGSFSSRLMGMKFMQRAAEKKLLGKRKAEVQQQEVADKWTSEDAPKGCRVIMEGDPLPEGLCGRISFKAMNPDAEKLQAGAQGATATPAEDEEAGGSAPEADLDDEQLAQTFAGKYAKVLPLRDPKRRKLR